MINKESKCPFHNNIAKEFQPFDLSNPFPFYKKAREEAPIFYREDLDIWVVTRYDDVKAVFKNWQAFTSQNAQKPVKKISEKATKILKDAGMLELSGLSARVPPDHTRIRNTVLKGFGLPRFKKLEPRIRALVIKTIETFEKDGKAELIQQLAYDLPAYVIFMLLGVPDKDVKDVKEWASSRLKITWGNLDEAGQIHHAENMVRYWEYCQNLVKLRHEYQSDDLPGDMVGYQKAGEEITDREIAAVCYSQLFAGHETTTSLIVNGIRELLTYRHNWEQICENQKLIPGAINEILRYSPSIISWRRRCVEATIVGGVEIPKDSNVLMIMASANRDSSLFENGETFDITRKSARKHLSFGFGMHYCIGNGLALLEYKIILEELTRRMPSLRLMPNQTYEFTPNTSFRAPVALSVEWDV